MIYNKNETEYYLKHRARQSMKSKSVKSLCNHFDDFEALLCWCQKAESFVVCFESKTFWQQLLSIDWFEDISW